MAWLGKENFTCGMGCVSRSYGESLCLTFNEKGMWTRHLESIWRRKGGAQNKQACCRPRALALSASGGESGILLFQAQVLRACCHWCVFLL